MKYVGLYKKFAENYDNYEIDACVIRQNACKVNMDHTFTFSAALRC